MNRIHVDKISRELNLTTQQAQSTALLLEDGATVPFIARYRKEVTGSLDEVAIASIRDRLLQLAELDSRREAILRSLGERGVLTDELKASLEEAGTMTVLEDLYLPFRPKRRTRATIAREKGLEPLALRLFSQDGEDPVNLRPEKEAMSFVDPAKGVSAVEEALAGARDIMAEWMSEDPGVRAAVRGLFLRSARFKSAVVPGKETEGIKYRDYYDWEEPVSTAPSHRVLAMRRGEREGMLSLRLIAPDEEAITLMSATFVKGRGPGSLQVIIALKDGYGRLLFPSMETEIRVATKELADREAIRVFADNLRQLLLAAPLGQKNILALDPGFRTGCKTVCLDRQGKLLHTDTIYPHRSHGEAANAGQTVLALIEKYGVEAIAVGNGTAGRETEAFLKGLALPPSLPVISVNESGASIYSASEAARQEFPDHDVTVRGSVSIGRRLMDPLAELVKIDPKSIGVGQYQHDVDQNALKKSLDDVVVSCVNRVGVEVNTASAPLLAYVSGLGPGLAKAIVQHRDEHGPFESRKEFLKVPRLGPKAFEQAAGFLRIRGAANPLDSSAVHPESYPIVEAMARDLGSSLARLMASDTERKRIDLNRYVTEKAGLPTLSDIMAELDKPGRDPRERFEIFAFAEGIEKMEDVMPGMRLPGIVTNITAFGAFVDVGVHQDGLVHISQLSGRFVKNPGDVVKVHQKVMVTVLEVDLKRKRISLSMKDHALPADKKK
jgi:protein Tex